MSFILKQVIIHWNSKGIEQQTVSSVICLIINTLFIVKYSYIAHYF